jgi:hypothetical protein
MHLAPSEESILRSLYEKEVRDHEATKLELVKLREFANIFLQEESELGLLTSADKLPLRALERARAAVRDLLPRGVIAPQEVNKCE